jgi:hypothetical protein
MTRKEKEIHNEIVDFIGGETDNDKIDALILKYAGIKEKEIERGKRRQR